MDNVAALAESIQPKGNTLLTTSVSLLAFILYFVLLNFINYKIYVPIYVYYMYRTIEVFFFYKLDAFFLNI